MSLALAIVLPLTSGPGKARMRLECEVDQDGYRLFAREGRERWLVLPAGASASAGERAWSREQVAVAAMLAGFSKREVERAIRKAEIRRR